MYDYVDLAQKLIALPTVDGNKEAFTQAWQVIDSELDTFKYKRYISNGYESRVYYGSGQMPKKFDVILNAHIDVVPGEARLFTPKIKGDKLFGRGAYDMKAATAVHISLFKELANSLPTKLGLQIVSDEEQGGNNGTKYQFEQGLKADFGLAGESGSNFKIKNQAKGIAWYKVTFNGHSSHAAKPWLGDNPIRQLSLFLEKLEAHFPTLRNDSWTTTLTPSVLDANNPAYNKTPDEVTLGLDCRFIPDDASLVESKLEALLPKSASLEKILSDGCHHTPDGHPLVQKLLNTAKAQGLESSLEKSHGTGDMRFFAVAGSNGVEFGPVGGNAHNHEEWVSLNSLQVYREVLRKWLI